MRQRCFQSGDAEGSALELDLLLVKGVRRVIGGDGVDRPVEDAFDQRLAIGRRRAAADSSCNACRIRRRFRRSV